MRIILPPDDRVIVSLRNIQKNIVFNNPLQHIPRLHIAAIKYIEREYGARGYFSANVYKYNFADAELKGHLRNRIISPSLAFKTCMDNWQFLYPLVGIRLHNPFSTVHFARNTK